MKQSLGMTLLAIYLVLVGLSLVFRLSFAYMSLIMGILALLSGVLILARR
jgi:hypothetical protein